MGKNHMHSVIGYRQSGEGIAFAAEIDARVDNGLAHQRAMRADMVGQTNAHKPTVLGQ